MTNVNQNADRTFFVTHVYVNNGIHLTVCGQFSSDDSRTIESLIRLLREGFDRGIGTIPPRTILTQNTIVCAFHEDNYYRARVIKEDPEYGGVYLHFIDYGNTEVVPPSHIRLLHCDSSGLKLQTLPPIAFEFVISKVVPFANTWNRCIVDHIKHILRYKEYPVAITTYHNRQVFTLYYNGVDFADFLMQNNMALPAPSDQIQGFRLPNDVPIVKHPSLPLYRAPSQETHGEPQQLSNNFPIKSRQPVKMGPPPKPDHLENWRKPQEIVQPSRPQSSVSPRSQDLPAFKSRNLEKSSVHTVTVSDVDDGPLKFSVQLQSCAQELETLMNNINSLPLKPLSQPPIPSSACLGRCSKDKMLRRAVVSTVNDTLQAKVFYVDFGDQETLAHTDIYEIPPQYANPPLLSVRFILSGVRDLNVTTEMKEFFKEEVLEKVLTLKVMPVEDSPLMHYGNLYVKDKSMLDILREQFPDSTIKFPKPLQLSAGTRENVHVSYVEACSKFYVQLDKNVIEQESLADLLKECVKIAPPVKPGHIKPGLKCIAHCSVDSQWYRAEVVQVTDTQVTVHYVDYGNDETIPNNALRSIRNDEVTKIPILAIQCALNGFESTPFNSDMDNKFESMVLDKPLVMNVLEEKGHAIVVDLFDINIKPIKNISTMLKNNDVVNDQQTQQITHWQQGEDSDISARTHRSKRSGVKTQPLRNQLHKSKPINAKNIREESDKWKNQTESSEATYENSSYENVKMKNWKNTENEEKRFHSRDQKSNGGNNSNTNNNRDWNNSQGERYNRDNSRNDRFNKDRDSGSRYDRNDRNDSNNRYDNENTSNNRYRDKSSGRRGYNADNRRSDRNSGGENTWSDKDSNASSRSSGRRGRRGAARGGGMSRGGRGGGNRRDARSVGRDGDNDRNFNNYNRSSTDRDFNKNGGGRFRGDNRRNDRNDRNDPPQNSEIDTWDPSSYTTGDSSLKSSQIPPPNITIGAVKDCELVYVTNPTDFYVQLIPDNAELDSVMEKIANIYESGGITLAEFNAKVGMNCIAQYSEDSKWYRAIIQSLDSSGAFVRFVDYGNMEIVSFDKIKEIESEFIKLPTQAIHAKLLAVSKSTWENDEIDRFNALTEMKKLEAEFVALDNDVYEVLLREIIDNHSQDMYINQEFSDEVNLMEAKEVAKSKTRSTRSKSFVQVQVDYAPLDQKWVEPHVNIGITEDVMVTWLTNPNDFYCQFLNNQSPFRSMMNEIQNAYTSRQPTNDYLQVGSSVIAIFIDDGAFYRAEIIEIKPGGTVVRYVDFGNCALVQQREIFRVEKKFMDLPKQAVHCSLKNIAPPNNGTWSKANIQEIDTYFNVEKLQCTFYEMNNDRYMVSLTNSDNDLGITVVEKGLAMFTGSSFNEEMQDFQPNNASAEVDKLETIDEVVSEIEAGEHLTITGDLTRVDISYLKGQLLRVKVSSVESVQKFHILLPSASESDKIITNFMAAQNTEVMPKLLAAEICLGAGCIIHSEKGWRRATVIDCSRKTDFDVRFIDTGEINVISLNDMLVLPSKLTGIQKQAVECSLKDTESSVTIDEKLKNLVENKEVIIRVDGFKKNTLLIDLFDELGQKIQLTNDDEDEKICQLCPMPIFYAVHRMSVAHINHSGSVWLKRVADLDTDGAVLHELYEYYSKSGQPLMIEEGRFCAALSHDENWYRARVVKKTDSGALIQYIDYGNMEDIAKDSLKELEPSFFKQFQLAIEVSLEFIVHGSEAEQRDILNNYLLNKEFYATIQRKNDKWFASLEVNQGSSIIDYFSLQNIVDNNVEAPSRELNETEDLMIGNEYRVIVSYADNPAQFWIQRVKDADAINKLSAILQNEIATYKPVKGVPEEKLLCAALNSENKLWCRAEIIDADDEMATVRLVDYGKTDIIATSDGDKIKYLPDSVKSIRCYSTKCRLNVIPVDYEDWPNNVCSAFTAKVMNSLNLKAVFIADSSPKRVELYANDECISDWLVKKGYAMKIGANETVIDELVELELDPKSAFVSHINSPNEFWVQEERSVADLEFIADRFLVAEMLPKVDEVKIGNLYVAKYPDDSSWYRAQVISHENEGTNVLYIDYGNSALSTEIREIPEDLTKIPPLSRKCRLIFPEGIKEWSEQACQEFIKMAGDGATIFLLDVIEEGDTSLVTLTLDGADIVKYLKSFCHVNETSSDAENTKIVIISHVNSPNEFWVHEQESHHDLDCIGDRLIEADNYSEIDEIKEGMMCVAKFPEDNCWYRAEVLSHGDTGTNVMYIDYGNIAVSTELRKIPHDLTLISPLARKCSLALPTGIEQWSDKACEEFSKRCLAENNEFIMDVINDADGVSTAKLSVKMTNEDITEHLIELCEKTVPVIEERLSPLGEENSPNVVISHVVSPAEFWTQAESKMTELEVMDTRLANAESFLTLTSSSEGTICAAKFPEDGEWYRAKILSHGDAGVEVLYIDYGNSAVSSEIRALPEDITNIPPLSTHCTLKMPEIIESWSKEACEKFIELVADGATMFELNKLEELGEDPTSIALLHNGLDVVEILVPLCSKIDTNQSDVLEMNGEDSTHIEKDIVANVENNLEQYTSIENVDNIPKIGTNTEGDSIDDVIYKKPFDDNDKTSSTSGVGLTSSDQSNISQTFNALDPLPEMLNSTPKPSNVVPVIATDDTMTDTNANMGNGHLEDTIIILDSTVEDETIEQSSVNIQAEELNESTEIISEVTPNTLVDKEIQNDDTDKASESEVKNSETSTFEEVSFKVVRRNSGDVNNDSAAINEDKNDISNDQSTDAHVEKCDIPQKSENLQLKIQPTDNAKTAEQSDDTLKRPSTPKTPHSEKLVAGVVTDHRIIESEDDEIIEVTIVKKEPRA